MKSCGHSFHIVLNSCLSVQMENDLFWGGLKKECFSLCESEPDVIANMANLSALLFCSLNAKRSNSINWLGFYRAFEGDTLILGPFQVSTVFSLANANFNIDIIFFIFMLFDVFFRKGKVACIRIPFGQVLFFL
jgi:hypothetical protein